MKKENLLDSSKIFVGFILRGKLNCRLDEGDITQKQYELFFNAALEFHRKAFLYAITNFPLEGKFLEHVRFINFYAQKCSFESVLHVAEKLKPYVQYSKKELNQFEEEFLLLQTMTLSHLSEEGWR